MNLEHIPKSFWHSLSASVFIFTLGTVYVTYKSGNLSLKYKDFEFATEHATQEIEQAKKVLEEALDSKEADIQRISAEKKSAEDALAMARSELANIKTSLAQKQTKEIAAEIAKLEEKIEQKQLSADNSVVLKSYQEKVSAKNQVLQVQDHLKNISAIQKTLRDTQRK